MPVLESLREEVGPPVCDAAGSRIPTAMTAWWHGTPRAVSSYFYALASPVAMAPS